MKTFRTRLAAFIWEQEQVCYAEEPFSRIQARLVHRRVTDSEIIRITDEIIGDAHASHIDSTNSRPFNISPEYLPYRMDALLNAYIPVPEYTLKKMTPLIYAGVKSQKISESIIWSRILARIKYQKNATPSMLIEQINWIEENIPEYKYQPGGNGLQQLPSRHSFLMGIMYATNLSPEVLTVLCSNSDKDVRKEASEHKLCPIEGKEARALMDFTAKLQ